MDLQQTFYLIGTITLTLYGLFLLAIIIVAIVLIKKILEFYKQISANIKKAKQIVENPQDMAQRVSEAIVNTAVSKVTNFFSGRKG